MSSAILNARALKLEWILIGLSVFYRLKKIILKVIPMRLFIISLSL